LRDISNASDANRNDNICKLKWVLQRIDRTCGEFSISDYRLVILAHGTVKRLTRIVLPDENIPAAGPGEDIFKCLGDF
jgi:hypothetical protein